MKKIPKYINLIPYRYPYLYENTTGLIGTGLIGTGLIGPWL